MLHETAFNSLPLGAIKPGGWLKDQLEIQASGFTGCLEEHWKDVGDDNGWLGGHGESWERGPYYVDGLLPLAYLLEDEALIGKANRWIEWSLASQRENGMFGPERITSVNQDIDKEQDWWHYMIMLKVMMQHEEATGDERIIPFLTKFFTYVHSVIEEQPLRGWAKARGAEMLLCIVWLYRRTKQPVLLELADIVAGQTTDWSDIFHEFPFWRKVEEWDWTTHVVNVAMGIKTPGVLFELNGNPVEQESVHRGIDSLMTYHGQAHGMFSGDEWLSGTHPSQGVELCAVVEYMFSMEQLTRIFGEGRFGDILEKVAFNALPAAISPDWTSHQYDQQVNQIICNVAPRAWSNGPDANVFGLEPNFGCCTANMHQGWPKLAAHLWMKDQEEGLVAVSYAPCTVRTTVGRHDVPAVIEVTGEYPFKDRIRIHMSLERAESFPLSLRIPAWCDDPVITLNGRELPFQVESGYARIVQHWQNGDRLELHLPMEVRLVSRNMYATSIERGPLVYVLPVKENWQMIRQRDMFHDWEIYPASPWKYGLLADTPFEIIEQDMVRQPFQAQDAPVRVKVRGQLIRDWKMEGNNAGNPPLHPDTDGQPITELELVPYGSARLRIGEFPLIGERRRADKH